MTDIRTLNEVGQEPVAALFLPGEAEGAIPFGTRIRKSHSEPGDSTPVGSLGTVLASHHFTDEMAAAFPSGTRTPWFIYFVEWDWRPGVPVGIADWKIEKADA